MAPRSVTRDDGPEHSGAPGEQGGHVPSDLEKGLARADDTIKRFTVVSALAGVASAAAAIVATVVAVYTATQLDGTTRQTERAINTIGNVVLAQQDEVNGISNETFALDNEVSATTNEAEQTAALIKPANESANAAVTGLTQQQLHFTLDERPRLDIADETYKAPNMPQRDARDFSRLIWNVPIANYGRTTAVNIHMVRYMSLGDEALTIERHTPPMEYFGSIVNGRSHWTTVVYHTPVDPNRLLEILLGHVQVIKLAIVVRYEDESGASYTDSFCEEIPSNGVRAICVAPSALVTKALAGMTKDKPDE